MGGNKQRNKNLQGHLSLQVTIMTDGKAKESKSDTDGTRRYSSVYRRKSMNVQHESSKLICQNDDEAEIIERRKKQAVRVSNTSDISNTYEKRPSLGLIAKLSGTEITEQYNHCIKLSAENKINIKNAFGLQMIDFMAVMLNKRDPNMSNLQVASRTLDVSTKIYGYRVDCIHTDALKMAGCLAKANNNEEVDDTQQNITTEDGVDEQKDKLKKRRRKQVLCSSETLVCTPEYVNLSSVQKKDSQTTDLLFQVSLPIHAKNKYQLHLFHDVLLDSAEHPMKENSEDDMLVPISKIIQLEDAEICSSFFNFRFFGWSENDVSEPHSETAKPPNNAQVNIDASIDNGHVDENVANYNFDLEDEQENLDPQEHPERSSDLFDFQKAMTSTTVKPGEYSYLQESVALHWAGPLHWKPKALLRSHSSSKVVGACRQDLRRKRKEILLKFSDEEIEAVLPKFSIIHQRRILQKTVENTWNESKITLPEDIHYDITNAFKLYYHPRMFNNHLQKDNLNTTSLENQIIDYNYDNENDTQNYCPDILSEEYEGEGEENCDNGIAYTQAFTGENLVTAPKQVNKAYIPFSLRAKKVDMRQLKYSIWKTLTMTKADDKNDESTIDAHDETEKAVVSKKEFSYIYDQIKHNLRLDHVEELTPALAFVSLLHLANEKTLRIEQTSDMSNLNVFQG